LGGAAPTGVQEVRRAPVEARRQAALEVRVGTGAARVVAAGAERSDAGAGAATSRSQDDEESEREQPQASGDVRAADHEGAGRGWRRMPRSSRSPWTARAAATRSGSREIVRASQSMYVGSKSAI